MGTQPELPLVLTYCLELILRWQVCLQTLGCQPQPYHQKECSSYPYLVCLSLFFLYVQSAQDKFVLKRQIKRINDLRKEIETKIGRQDLPALFSPLDETDLGTRSFVFEGITSWRSNYLSLTRIPAVVSILLIVFWLVTFFLNP
jgi:hypothetical protein